MWRVITLKLIRDNKISDNKQQGQDSETIILSTGTRSQARLMIGGLLVSVSTEGPLNQKSNYMVRLILMSLLNQSCPIMVHHITERERERDNHHLLLKNNGILFSLARGKICPIALQPNTMLVGPKPNMFMPN